jgi:hypothetical protein
VTPPILAPVPSTPLPGAGGGAGAAPPVKSWDETDYVCKAGDTYRSISAHFYLNEAYAEALQLYNRNHPRASDAMRRDGTLVPGETLYIPPSGILEERHSAVIPKPAPAAARPVPASYRSPDPQPLAH